MTERPPAKIIAGIDLGGTKILSAVADRDGRFLATDTRPTDAASGPDAVFARMIESLSAALSEAGVRKDDLAGIGIAVPGPVNQAEGTVTDPPNLPGWGQVSVRDGIGRTFTAPIFVEND